MTKNVLIASLGDHPAVISGMINKLRAELQIEIHEAVILHTKGSGKNISLGFHLLREVLPPKGITVPDNGELPFADPITEDNSIFFLQTLDAILAGYETADDQVYLSLAGGRKNMSALMAVITQFYPAVKGLFHLIDKIGRGFPSVEELIYMTPEQQLMTMEPPVEHILLVEIPYACFSNAYELRRYFQAIERDEFYAVEVSGLAEDFYGKIWRSTSENLLQVHFSQTAFEEYEQFRGTNHQKFFDSYFRDMKKSEWLKTHIHPLENFQTDCCCLKKGGRGSGSIQERPFVYKDGNRVVVCRLTLHGSTYEELIERGSLWQKDYPAVKALTELYGGEIILLVPLGESPMVASQTYTLLQTRNREWQAHKVAAVFVIYPGDNGLIENGAALLGKTFKNCGIKFEHKPIKDLEDVANYEDCQIYLKAILDTIQELQTSYPDKQIALSLSGGRKGMSALTLFAAQRAGVEQVYHTLITDAALEQQVQKEGEYDYLRLKSRTEQEEILFLKKYDLNQFILFPIPVIPFSGSAESHWQ